MFGGKESLFVIVNQHFRSIEFIRYSVEKKQGKSLFDQFLVIIYIFGFKRKGNNHSVNHVVSQCLYIFEFGKVRFS